MMAGCYIYPHCLQGVPGDVQAALGKNLWRRQFGLLADSEFDALPGNVRANWYYAAGLKLPSLEAVGP